MTTLPSKQKALIDRCRQDGQITTKLACQMLAGYYYSNHEHYVSELLTRMVKSGKLVRVKVGVYELGTRRVSSDVEVNQSELF